jgi:protein gp37
MAKRLAAMATADQEAGRNAGKKAAYLKVINRFGRWNGSVFLDDLAVEEPLSWRSPRVIFVNSMSDLFHDDVPADFIARVFDVMKRCPQHTFQVLTKRPERVLDLNDEIDWPCNVWMGTSVEDIHVVERVRKLRDTCAEVKFLSVEPLIGPIPRLPLRNIDWVIVGGESGPGARPMQAEWVRQIRDRCLRYEVPFFFKQWGGPNKGLTGRTLDGRTWDEMPALAHEAGARKTDERGPVSRRRGSPHSCETSNPQRVPKSVASHLGAWAKQSLTIL